MIQIVLYLPILGVLTYLSYTDIKKREVPHWGLLALFLYSFFLIQDYKENAKIALFVFSVLLIVYLIFHGSIGGGDVKLLSVMAFLMGVNFVNLLICLLPLLIIRIAYGIYKFKNIWFSIPLVPYISVAYLFAILNLI